MQLIKEVKEQEQGSCQRNHKKKERKWIGETKFKMDRKIHKKERKNT